MNNSYNPRLNEINPGLAHLYPNLEDPIGETLTPGVAQQTVMREQQIYNQVQPHLNQIPQDIRPQENIQFFPNSLLGTNSVSSSPHKIIKVIDLVINLKLNIEVGSNG